MPVDHERATFIAIVGKNTGNRDGLFSGRRGYDHRIAPMHPEAFAKAFTGDGLMIVFLRFAGRLSAQISWVDDCLNRAEVDGMERDVRQALLEELPA